MSDVVCNVVIIISC